ncbi:MAG: hypothetical protein HY907_12385 [Deltaproteobacteria bacterium]|nr:hypothetical protein [Deltaproteobacteria bacterium]
MTGADAWLALAGGVSCAIGGAVGARRARRRHPEIDLRSALRLTRGPWIAVGCMLAAIGAGVILDYSPFLAWELPHLVELHFLAFAGATFFGPAGYLFGFTIQLAFATSHRRRWRIAAALIGTFLGVGIAWAVVTHPIWDELGHAVTDDGYILQTSSESCAAASAANIARELGLETTEREMAERLGTTVLGSSPAEVIEGLGELGVECRRFERDADPTAVAAPAMLFVDHPATGPESHAVAFVGMDGDQALVVDPLYGLRKQTPEHLRARWHGHGLECSRR